MAVTTRTVDVVAILDSNSQQVIPNARPLRGTVFEVGKLMEHPLEDGSLMADHFVREPIEIDLPVMFTGAQAAQDYDQLRQLFNAATILTVLTRAGSYASMVLVEIPHDETPEVVDGLTVNVRFREARFVTPTTSKKFAPKAKAKATTKKRGAQQTTTANTATEQRGSLLYRLSHRGKK